MIFVTVGTHEQSFDRLVKEIDLLKEKGIIKEEVYIQTGYSEYIPKNCQYKSMIGYDEMVSYVKEARIVITHGGPGSIFLPIQYAKKPIVVPRNPKYNEHVDNHQIDFAKRMYNEKRVDLVLDIKDLEERIVNYKNYTETSNVNSIYTFNNELNNIINYMFKSNN